MRAFSLGLCLTLLVSFSGPACAYDQDKIVGVWKLTGWVFQDASTKEIEHPYGDHPIGYLILTPSRMAMVASGEGRKVPHSVQDDSVALNSLVAYSGAYHLEGDKWIINVDIAWNEALVGTEQIRYYRIEDSQLYIRTSPRPMVNFANRVMTWTQIWEREE
jgi:hypothetical protein